MYNNKVYDLGFEDFINKENNKKYFKKIVDALQSKDVIKEEILDGSLLNLQHTKMRSTVKNGRTIELLDTETGNILGKYSFSKDPLDFHKFDSNKVHYFLIQHTDLDGDSSAAMVLQSINADSDVSDVEVYRFSYSNGLQNILNSLRDLKLENTFSGDTDSVYICIVVDISMRDEYINELYKEFNYLIWFDHHSTSFETINKFENNKIKQNKLLYALDSRFSAAYLVYSIINQFDERININPYLAGLISTYDIKQDKKYPLAYGEALALNQYYIDNGTMSSLNDIWKYILPYTSVLKKPQEALDSIISVGHQLKNLNDIKLKLMLDSFYLYSYHYEDGDVNVIFKGINGIGNSTRFCGEEYTVSCIIKRNLKQDYFTISLYSDDEFVQNNIGLGKFCSKYLNGGGHPGAAGSVVNKHLIDYLNKIINLDEIDVGEETYILTMYKGFKSPKFDGEILDDVLFHESFYSKNNNRPEDFYKKDSVIDYILRTIFILFMYEYKKEKKGVRD